jgi:hypothetical protein
MPYRHVSVMCMFLLIVLAGFLAVMHESEKDCLGAAGRAMVRLAIFAIMPAAGMLGAAHASIVDLQQTPRQAWRAAGKWLLWLARGLAGTAIAILLTILAKALGWL